MSLPVEQRLIFAHVVEGLFHRALKTRLTPRLKGRVRDEAGLDLDARLEPAIPLTTWWRCLELVAEELYPQLPQAEAIEQIGVVLTQGYFETFVGAALKGLLRVIGPARALRRMDRSLRSGNNFAEVKVTELGPTHFQFWCNEVGTTRHIILGLLRAGAEVAGARNIQGRVTHFDDQGMTLDVAWDG